MTEFTRRRFIKAMGAVATTTLATPRLRSSEPVALAYKRSMHPVYVARYGTPATNIHAAIELAGGIASFVGYDDLVMLKPNGQWENQGYTNTDRLSITRFTVLTQHVHNYDIVYGDAAPDAGRNTLVERLGARDAH
jgi:hypothetical protein